VVARIAPEFAATAPMYDSTASTSVMNDATSTSVERFCELNPDLSRIEAERDARSGIMLLIDVGIFCFLLFSPILSLVAKMTEPWVIAIELAIIFLIGWCCIEYGARRVVWFDCLARGVVVTFEKTNTVGAWSKQPPMYLAYSFLLIHAFVTYLGFDPKLNTGDVSDIITACLSVLAVLFVLLLTKNMVDLEGANALLTIPMFFYFFNDSMLRERGFNTASFADLAKYILVDRIASDDFSWNEIHALQPSKGTVRKTTLIDGVRIAWFLRPYKNKKC
jgi:hypothetical protein